jgi:hypothetical protein
MDEPSRKVVEMTIAALRNAPNDWTFGHHEAENKKLQVKIWIANSYYGLHIIANGIRIGETATFGRLVPWRRQLMSAVREASATRMLETFRQSYPEAFNSKEQTS